VAVSKNQQHAVQRLAKKLKLLQKKEERSRNKLAYALQNMQKRFKAYQAKVANKSVKAYLKVAERLQAQMHKRLEAKTKALNAALLLLEKQLTAKISKSVAKKPRKIKKRKKT
jgi:hypothetical protein